MNTPALPPAVGNIEQKVTLVLDEENQKRVAAMLNQHFANDQQKAIDAMQHISVDPQQVSLSVSVLEDGTLWVYGFGFNRK